MWACGSWHSLASLERSLVDFVSFFPGLTLVLTKIQWPGGRVICHPSTRCYLSEPSEVASLLSTPGAV